jgi:3-hydroxybutyryl-CoA dehydrogenase
MICFDIVFDLPGGKLQPLSEKRCKHCTLARFKTYLSKKACHMQIAVRSNAQQQEEWLQKGAGHASVHFITDLAALAHTPFTAFVDLLFTPGTVHPPLPPGTIVVVHAVTATCSELPEGAIRINAWPGFLQRPVTELAAATDTARQQAAELMDALEWPYQLVPDIPGMITSRVVAGIINEAYFALEEDLSSRQEIDTAMKLGTNYPYGPFEWAEKIGVREVHSLLQALQRTDERYAPAASMAAGR